MTDDQLNLAVKTLCQKIGGNWLLLGGSLIRFLVDPNRGTHDIDLVKIPIEEDLKTRTEFILEMKSIGLSPEQINSSVSFFVSRIPGWENSIVEIMSGPRGKVFRPTLTLFSILKIQRGTEIDLEDIKAAKNRWGLMDFDPTLFQSWATAEQVEVAKQLGLL